MSERIKPRIVDNRYGIINPYGQFWTDDTFASPEQAAASVTAFWKGNAIDISRFSYVPVVVTIIAVEKPAVQVEPIAFPVKP
jgi:hypothetical protein